MAEKQTNEKYGAPELKRKYQKYFSIGLAIGIGFHLIALFTYYGATHFGSDEERIPVLRLIKYTDLTPPPSLLAQQVPQVAVSAPVAKPTVGIPVPVPDAEVSPEQTIATQQEMSQAAPVDVGSGGGKGDSLVVTDMNVEDEPDINAFIPVEREPQPVKKVSPPYPEIAKRAGVEGKVYIKALVDKEGRVKKAVVLKSDAEIFNQYALDAVHQWVFTPALMNNGPVTVWVVVPFNFQLKK
ncbi:MAG: TonB family protein [Bacteroidota bacterium]